MTKTKQTKYSFDSKNHIHLLGNKPLKGATTLIGRVLPPPLAYYGSGMACKELGWYDRNENRANYLPDEKGKPIAQKKLDELKEMEVDDYLKTLDKAYKAHATYRDKRAKEGTNTHEMVEKAVKEAIKSNNGYLEEEYDDKLLNEFAKWGKGKKFHASEVHVFSEKIWVGGIIDLVYEENGEFYIGDIKTSKGIYESHVIQQGLYDYCQAENGFVSPKGTVVGKPKKIKGYSIVKLNKGLKAKTYYNTERMKEFAENISQMDDTLLKLEEFIKSK